MKQTALQFDVVTDETALRALQPEWEKLWSNAQGLYYQSFSFCWVAWQQVAKPHGRKLHCIVGREAGRLAMIWPLVTYRRALWTYAVPLGPEGGDYTSVLVEEGPDASALIAGAWRVARQRCGADFLHVPYVKEELELYKLASREPHLVYTDSHHACVAHLRNETGWDAYCGTLGTLSGRKPGALERRLSKEGRVEVRFVDPSDFAETERVIDWILMCKRSWSDRVGRRGAWLDSPEFRNYLVHLVCPAEVQSMASIVVVTLDGALVAANVVSLVSPCASGVIASFDPRYGKFCPGMITVEFCVKWAVEHGIDLDFGVGPERFKSYWSRDNAGIAWTVQTINTRWGWLAVHGRRAARELIKRVRRTDRKAIAPRPEGAKASGAMPRAEPQE